MKPNDFLEMLTNYANNPYITHRDYRKCGQCYKEKIKSNLAKEYITQNKTDNSFLNSFFEESDQIWKTTEIYQEVQKLIGAGKTLEQALAEMETRGYTP